MYVITISKWKKKLATLLVLIILVMCLGLSLSRLSESEEASVNAPADQNLQDDVLSQPVKVQAEPENNALPTAEVKEK